MNHRGYLDATGEQQKRIGSEYRCRFAQKITDERWNEFMETTGDETLNAAQARRNFCTSTTWANQPMITFVSQVLSLNILFIDTSISKLFCGVHGNANEPMIIILWVERSHFEPVGACRALHPKKTGVQFVFDPVRDAQVVNHIVDAYRAQCDV